MMLMMKGGERMMLYYWYLNLTLTFWHLLCQFKFFPGSNLFKPEFDFDFLLFQIKTINIRQLV